MAFYEEQFPPNISYQAQGGPGFQTQIVVVASGAESRNVDWEQARYRFDVAHAARLSADSEAVKAFFVNMQGRAHGFRYKDWTDFTVTTGQGVFVQLTGTTFQMYKRYVSGSRQYDRIIQKPVSGTASVTGGTAVSVDYTTGIVSVSSGTPTAWTGQFDVPVRFDLDELVGEIISRAGASGELIVGWTAIPLVEIRV